MLIGKVKSFVECHYRFKTSDSINHDDFMMRFYQCGFDSDKMLSFADSLNPVSGKECYSKEYDSFDNRTKIGDARYQYEYDNQGRMLKEIVVNGVSQSDTVSFNYDGEGRFLEKRRHNRSSRWVYDSKGNLLERKVVVGDSVVELFNGKYDRNGGLRRSEYFGGMMGQSRIYYEFDSRGNVTFERNEHNGIAALTKTRTRYKYDKNDSVVKKTMHETRWHDNGSQGRICMSIILLCISTSITSRWTASSLVVTQSEKKKVPCLVTRSLVSNKS